MRIERQLKDGDGTLVTAEVTIDEGALLEREIARLANKARATKSGVAKSGCGVIKVKIVAR